MGHLGMLPQTLNGKYSVYGKKKDDEIKILDDLHLLQKSGVFSIVIECTVEPLVRKVLNNSKVPIIGIGATSECHGQIIVAEDMLGMTDFKSKFLKKILEFAVDNF